MDPELQLIQIESHLKDHTFRDGLTDFLAGSLGGVCSVYVSQPLDTVKVKMQAFPELYRGMVNCMIQTFKNDGIYHGLYAGTLPAVIANVAENSVLFAAYGGCQKIVTKTLGYEDPKQLNTLGNALSGFLAAFFSTFTLCPTELVKCKLQALHEMGGTNHISPLFLAKQIYKAEGIAGFYRGLIPTFAREMPGYFFFFGGYEGCRELFRKPDQTKNDIGPLKTMISGAVGGIALWIAIFPADVIKSRIQIHSLKVGMIPMGLSIVRSEGVLALYNGLLPTVLRTIPATATLFLVYEYTKKFIETTFPK
ncbi:mitochondrial ornithine transporter 1 [Condylostylus longicornis]|uniref:mitochondrial ornithine transporter 1 n=1 Tax=Condylostylus longicornis TaxID=2530218 RepID=UPI00244DEF3B|nr:mitochondrial ornithine transporter 1 [Condylostylus longicornis]